MHGEITANFYVPLLKQNNSLSDDLVAPKSVQVVINWPLNHNDDTAPNTKRPVFLNFMDLIIINNFNTLLQRV